MAEKNRRKGAIRKTLNRASALYYPDPGVLLPDPKFLYKLWPTKHMPPKIAHPPPPLASKNNGPSHIISQTPTINLIPRAFTLAWVKALGTRLACYATIQWDTLFIVTKTDLNYCYDVEKFSSNPLQVVPLLFFFNRKLKVTKYFLLSIGEVNGYGYAQACSKMLEAKAGHLETLYIVQIIGWTSQ